MDPQKFPAAIPLRGVIQNDTRLCRFKKGEIIVRQGDYGGSAFFILSGDTRVVLETLDETVIGRLAAETEKCLQRPPATLEQPAAAGSARL